MTVRNKLRQELLSSNHSYDERFTLDSNGLMITSIIGGVTNGIVLHSMIYQIDTSIEKHFNELKDAYKDYKHKMPANER